AIVPALAIWLSGLACLIVCASTCARAEAAPTAHPRACCARSAQIEAEESCGALVSLDEIRGEPSFDGCCFLTARSTTQAPVPKSFTVVPSSALARTDFWIECDASLPQPSPPATPVLDRGDTHLRCCVFLI